MSLLNVAMNDADSLKGLNIPDAYGVEIRIHRGFQISTRTLLDPMTIQIHFDSISKWTSRDNCGYSQVIG